MLSQKIKGVSDSGYSLNPAKVEKLQSRLENQVFQCMQTASDPLYSSELCKLIKDCKKIGKEKAMV